MVRKHLNPRITEPFTDSLTVISHIEDNESSDCNKNTRNTTGNSFLVDDVFST